MDYYNDIINSLDEYAFLDTQTSVICIVLCLLWIYFLIRKPSGLPPGPSWRAPILGHLREFTRHANLRTVLDKYREKYGEVYSLYLGRHLVVIVNGVDAIREAFVTRGEEFCCRPDTVVQHARDRHYGLLNKSRTTWSISRTLTFNTLQDFGFSNDSVEAPIQDDISYLTEEIGAYHDVSFSPKHIITTSIFNMNCSIILGTKYNHGDPEFQRVLALMRRSLSASRSTSLLNFLPLLRYLPGDFFRFKEYENIINEMNDFFENRTKACKKMLDDGEAGGDLITAFLKADRENDGNSGGRNKLTKDELKVIICDMFAAGSETTAKTLYQAISNLINYPDIQSRIYQEICSHVGKDRKPGLKDRNRLVNTEAFILETQRLANLMILNFPYTVQENVTFRGYMVPKGTMILPDIQAALSEPKLWGDPKVFRPGRFVTGDGQLRSLEGFLPFLVGQRNRIGEQLANVELFLLVSALVQRFEFCSPAEDGADTGGRCAISVRHRNGDDSWIQLDTDK